jgi:uncharacterized protein (DUF2147 family)
LRHQEKIVKKLIVFVLTLMLSTMAGLAGDETPAGAWESSTGESRYKISMCGDGTQLCAKLTWLRADARTTENLQYLNKYVVRGAKMSGPNSWKGAVNVYGESANGSITVIGGDKLRLVGCRIIICQTMEFNRI